jgi:ribose-phosphate pyrophosphokinase
VSAEIIVEALTSGCSTRMEYESFIFSGGERHVRLFDYSHLRAFPDAGCPIRITAHLRSNEAIMELLLVCDALRRLYPDNKLRLRCPYLPYARQDRVMQMGESLALKVLCSLVNDLSFEKIEVWDVHSDVGLALLEGNVEHKGCEMFVPLVPAVYYPEDVVLVAPDAGASKKVSKVARAMGKPMVQASKKRDTRDGSITATEVFSEHIGGRNFLIVDDICDGGRTFIELAKVLRPLTDGKIFLYVTHGIFSKGVEPFRGLIDGIYCPNIFDRCMENDILHSIPTEVTR